MFLNKVSRTLLGMLKGLKTPGSEIGPGSNSAIGAISCQEAESQ